MVTASFEFEKLQRSIDEAYAKSVETQGEWLMRLHYEWEYINYYYFKNRLNRPPVFILFQNNGQWAYWHATRRTIGMSYDLLCNYSWETVEYVLKHEMAHQYASEVLFDKDETSHGPSFQKACDLLGIPGASSCVFDDSAKSQESLDGDMIRKIKKMLALATSANENEAKTAMAMANKALLKYNLDKKSLNTTNIYKYKYIGGLESKIAIEKVVISNILQDHFFVKVLWTHAYNALDHKKGSKLQICGTPENLEIAEYVYHFLLNQLDHLWKHYKTTNNLRLNKLRKSFIYGLLTGFREKLESESANSKNSGLIWVGDSDLDDVHVKINPSMRSKSASRVRIDPSTLEDGREVGRKLNLHMGIKESGGFGGHIE